MGFDIMKDNPLDYLLPPRSPIVNNKWFRKYIQIYKADVNKWFQVLAYGTTPERKIGVIRRINASWLSIILDKANADFWRAVQSANEMVLAVNPDSRLVNTIAAPLYFRAVGGVQYPAYFSTLTQAIPVWNFAGAAIEPKGGVGVFEGPWIIPPNSNWYLIVNCHNSSMAAASVNFGYLYGVVDYMEVEDPDRSWAAMEG